MGIPDQPLQFAIAYNVSTSIFGGTAPAVNDWLVNSTGDKLVPAYYMMAACVVGAIALIKVPETTRCPMNGTECPGTAKAPPQLEYQKEPSRV
jgi:MFS transporter, MHS family, proline/betaine transporter